MTDRRDPICGMQGTIEYHGLWFCSQRCIAEFKKRESQKDSCHQKSSTRWLLDPWFWVPISGVALVAASQLWPKISGVGTIYLGYVKKIGLPFLVGLVLGGIIDHFVPREYIIKLLSGSRKRVIARATFLGFLASACSHGCLALAIELYRKGASVPAVVSFLLASPWASMALTFLLLSLFGLKGLVIILSALVISSMTGLVFQRLARRGIIETNPHTVSLEENFSILRNLRNRWQGYSFTPAQLMQDFRGILKGMLPLGRMVLGWVQLGLILSALGGFFIPTTIFHQFLGPSPGGLLLTLAAATLIEVCSEGTAPLAYEIYRHTGALGNAFAFLMAGVITDYTELAAVWTNIGRRTVLWMLVVALPMVFLVGVLLNGLGAN